MVKKAVDLKTYCLNKNKIGGTTKEWSQNIYDLKIKELLLDI